MNRFLTHVKDLWCFIIGKDTSADVCSKEALYDALRQAEEHAAVICSQLASMQKDVETARKGGVN